MLVLHDLVTDPTYILYSNGSMVCETSALVTPWTGRRLAQSPMRGRLALVRRVAACRAQPPGAHHVRWAKMARRG